MAGLGGALIFAALLGAQCQDVATLTEVIEQTPPAKREAQLAAWKRVTAHRQEKLQLVLLAEANVRAGIPAAQVWRTCTSY